DDLVEAVGDLALDAGPVRREACGEIAVRHGGQRCKKLAAIERLVAMGGLAAGAIAARRAFPGWLGGRDFHCDSATKLGRSAERKMRRAAAITCLFFSAFRRAIGRASPKRCKSTWQHLPVS